MSATCGLNKLAGAVLLSVFAAMGLSAAEPHSSQSPAEVQRKLQDNTAILIDVREKKEWAAGHLQQAQLLPLSEIGQKIQDPVYRRQLAQRLPTDKTIYLHCKSGGRCVLAAEALRTELGADYRFEALQPGFEELRAAGFPAAEKAKATTQD